MKPLVSALFFVMIVFPLAVFSQRPRESDSAYQARTKWFQDAKFGMFIHWGAGCLYKDGQGGNLSWVRPGKRPLELYPRYEAGPEFVPSYDTNYRHFNPTEFDAAAIVAMAKNTGMKYLVVIAKHHEGFSMWDTRQRNSRQKKPAAQAAPWDTVPYGIMHSPYKKDVIRQFADASRAAGLRFGVYYSPRDWYNWDYGKGNNGIYDAFMRAQVAELLDNYNPDIMWWDSFGRKPKNASGTSRQYWKCAEILRWVEQKSPAILNNNRCVPLEDWHDINKKDLGAFKGDFDTPEGSASHSGRRVGEGCISIINGWSWDATNTTVKSTAYCIRAMVNLAVANANLLLNIGPKPDGTVHRATVDTLTKIGEWMKKYGESIYGTRKGPIKAADWGGTTCRDSMLYVHLTKWKGTHTITLPEGVQMVSARKLTPGRATITQDGQKVTITLESGGSVDPVDDIVAIKTNMLLHDSKGFATATNAPASKNARQMTRTLSFLVSGDRFTLPGGLEGKRVVLYDLRGRMVKEAIVTTPSLSLRMNFGVKRGVYMVKLK